MEVELVFPVVFVLVLLLLVEVLVPFVFVWFVSYVRFEVAFGLIADPFPRFVALVGGW